LNTFKELDLIEPLQRAVAEQGYERPTPIQAQAIPLLLDGRDVLGCAQTGTGKTAAFSLPILQHLAEHPGPRGKPKIRVLVMTPTRELAAQIGESFGAYGRHLRCKHTVIFGGVNERPQIATLRSGIEILVATPGRLLDLAGRGFVDLGSVDFFVLDEADRMLDMGFVRDVRRVLTMLPPKRQNLLFSATMPESIRTLADSFLQNPEFIAVTPQATTVERIDQSVMFVDRGNKRHLLVDIIKASQVERAIVFTRTKHGANRLTKQLIKADMNALAVHGNKSQGARKRALDGFRNGEVTILVATDIASRGIDVDGVSHVFNFDLPNEPESYVHRIGRTARAGRDGVAVSFCDATETEYLIDIERTIGQAVPRVTDHEYHCPEAIPAPADRSGRRGGSAKGKSSRGRPSQSRSGGGDRGRQGRGGQGRSGGGDRGRQSRSSGQKHRGRGAGSQGQAPSEGPRRSSGAQTGGSQGRSNSDARSSTAPARQSRTEQGQGQGQGQERRSRGRRGKPAGQSSSPRSDSRSPGRTSKRSEDSPSFGRRGGGRPSTTRRDG